MRPKGRGESFKAKSRRLKAQSLRLRVFVFGLILFFILIGSLFSLQQKAEGSGSPTPVFGFKVVRVFPHDPKAFTQGLVFHQGFLYEGTGLLGKSSLRKVKLETGQTVKLYQLPYQFFGEGITLWQNKIIQLTWKTRTGFVYDRGTFQLLRKFTYPTEGWGITQDGKYLIMSDGTSFLHFLDPDNFKEVKRIQVHDRGLPVTLLNELEYIQGKIYANVYLTDRIVRISPKTGRVTGWIDLQGLLPATDRAQGVDVLNGIAYDAQENRIFVTGKYWPKVFEIRLVPR